PLNFSFTIFHLIFRNTVVYKFTDLLVRIFPQVSDGYTATLCLVFDLLSQVATALFGKRWNQQPDNVSVVLRVESNVGIDNRFFYTFQKCFLPGLNDKRPCIGR